LSKTWPAKQLVTTEHPLTNDLSCLPSAACGEPDSTQCTSNLAATRSSDYKNWQSFLACSGTLLPCYSQVHVHAVCNPMQTAGCRKVVQLKMMVEFLSWILKPSTKSTSYSWWL